MLLLVAILATAVAAVVLGAVWQAAWHGTAHATGHFPGHSHPHWVAFVPALATEVFVVGWAFWIGASVGSFLNVVAWRMPRGRSINGRSHCPRCHLPLAWRDNLPVLGWLALGGRCRGCRLPISARYPLVEAAVGVSIAWVAYTAVQSAGSHLPYPDAAAGRHHAHSLLIGQWLGRPLAVMLYQVVMLANLWALALVRADGSGLPGRLVVWCFATTIVPLLVWPELAMVPWTLTAADEWLPAGDRTNAVMRIVTSLTTAIVLTGLLARSFSLRDTEPVPVPDPDDAPDHSSPGLNSPGHSSPGLNRYVRRTDLCVLLAFVGLMVGWQALLPVTATACLVGCLLPAVFFHSPDRLARVALALPLVVTVQLVLWGQLHRASWWLSVNSSPESWLIWILMLLALSRFEPQQG